MGEGKGEPRRGLSGEIRTPGIVIPNHAFFQLNYAQIRAGLKSP